MKLTSRQRLKGYRQLAQFNEEIENLEQMAHGGEESQREFWRKILQSMIAHRDALKTVLNHKNETNK